MTPLLRSRRRSAERAVASRRPGVGFAVLSPTDSFSTAWGADIRNHNWWAVVHRRSE
jgi:hypothetical protein